MAVTRKRKQQEALKSLDNDCIKRGGSSGSHYVTASETEFTAVSNYVTAHASETDFRAVSASGWLCGGGETGKGGSSASASVEEQIQRSKSHWSELTEPDSDSDDDDDAEVAEDNNVRVFQALQLNPTRGFFFCTFDGDGMKGEKCLGELRVGEKFAEGAQAELFHACVTWYNKRHEIRREYPTNKKRDENGREWVTNLRRGGWVVKAFKKGTFLSDLQSQWPNGLFRFLTEELENAKSSTPKRFPRYYCHVHKGILLKDGRFAFLMWKEDFDLRTVIERNMKLRSGKGSRPFTKEEAKLIMYKIALGIDWLHSHDIVHRDLKASNVLVYSQTSGSEIWQCLVADYECSVGVVGTGFFRAPEILQACKERNLWKKKEVFSKAADIYSFGMICYEILTGELPFKDHSTNDYDVVLKGGRVEVPKYVENWIRELLNRCWELNPRSRPRIGEILDLFVGNSIEVKGFNDECQKFMKAVDDNKY